MGLFSKETSCEKCGKRILKGNIFFFDGTHDQQYGRQQDYKVCQTCLFDLFFRAIRDTDESFVVIAPLKGAETRDGTTVTTCHFNAYKRLGKKRAEVISTIRSLIPSENTRCNRCDKKAMHAWCIPKIVNRDPIKSWVRNEEGKPEYLCNDCLEAAFRKHIADEKLDIPDVRPPVRSEGAGVITPLGNL